MEAEDMLWKQIYNKLQKQNSVNPENTDHELRYVRFFLKNCFLF